ncbi:MAG: polysaccharide deacetylase family protein [Acidobacteriaceae bacterium]|jgi:peptidoglycan/xylan/chitin deacetylase (PgdA/CDA1 family)
MLSISLGNDLVSKLASGLDFGLPATWIPEFTMGAGVRAATALAAGSYAYAGMWPGSQLFGPCVVAAKRPAQIALTYDDGPADPDTFHLLDVLAKHNVRATFFMIGRFVRQRPEIARAVAAAGHLIGNHTMTHPLLLFRSAHSVRQQLRDCNAALEDALGAPVRWFRPPHGSRRPDILRSARELGLTTVMWNAMGFDWRPTTPEAVQHHVLRSFRKNQRRGQATNALLHDGGQADHGQDRSHTVAATDRLITYWKNEFAQRGETCEFVTPEAWA